MEANILFIHEFLLDRLLVDFACLHDQVASVSPATTPEPPALILFGSNSGGSRRYLVDSRTGHVFVARGASTEQIP